MKLCSKPATVLSLWLGYFSFALLSPAIAAPLTNVLTSAAQVRALTVEASEHYLPVHLLGTVIDAGGSGIDIHDGSNAVYLLGWREMANELGLQRGDYVEADGFTEPGEFAPVVRLKTLHKLGTRPLPKPLAVTYDELASGVMDAQWVEISGIVHYCAPSPNNPQRCRLEMETGGGRLIVRLNLPRVAQPLVDAQVRLRGVCYYLFNKNRQAVSPMLSVFGDEPIDVEVPAPADGFGKPVRPIDSLMRFSPEVAYGHRVHVQGIVTAQQPGEIIWISDKTSGLRVQTAQTNSLSPGDEVDVLGFPKPGDCSPMLEDGVFRVREHGPEPAPAVLTHAADAIDHDASLVQLDAVVTERQMIQNGWTLALQSDDGTAFKALLRLPKGEPPPQASVAGTRVRLAGICSAVSEYKQYSAAASGLLRPETFQLLLRSPSDLAIILPPPWWTRQRIFWLLGGVSLLSLMGIAGVIVLARRRLHKQVDQRNMAEAEFTAILSERNRMAREIHDTLAQGLGAVTLHLGLAAKRLGDAPDDVKGHLNLAHAVARASLADARNAIFDMRSQVLENGDLPHALGGILHQMTDGTDVESRIEVIGRARRLPPTLENALLRVGQEAITNAGRHGQPHRIDVTLDFGEKEIQLAVKDDGRGFDAGVAPPGHGSFGLVGMRERAAELRGELAVNSRPGEGTQVRFTVPAPS